MRGHRPTQRGSATQRRRRTLSGGPPINLETIVESPAPLNPNHPHWWRRRASIDSSQSGDYDNDGNRSEVSSISTADTRKQRLNKNHSDETDGDYGGYKTADDGYDNMDGSLKSMDSIDLAQQTIMVVHSMPSKVPARPSPPRSPPEVNQYHSSPEHHTPKSNKKGHRRRSSFPPPATPTNSDEVIDEHSTNNQQQQLTPPISNSTSHFSPTPQDRSDRSGKSTKGSGPHRRPSISDKSINSITFLPDKNESDSYSDESNGSTNSDDMEVMDLRPQGQASSWENSSMVSFSEFSMDSELASGLFQAQGYLSDGSKGKVHTRSGNRLPTEHWVAATHTAHGTLNESQAQAAAARAAARARGVNTDVNMASFATSTGSGGSAGRLTGRRWTEGGNDVEGGGGNALGESEQAYRALMSLMGHNQPTSPSPLGSSVNTSDFHPGLTNFTPGTTASGGRGSMMSVASQSSGFWSAMGDLTADNSSVCTDVSDETSLALKKKRQLQRSIYIKRCARAMMILVVLSLVSCTAIYFIAGDGDMVLPFGLSNRFKSSSSSQEAMPHLVQDDRDLIFEPQDTDPQDAQQQHDYSSNSFIDPQDTNPFQGMTSQEVERYQRENRPGIKYGEEHKRELKERNMKLRAERIKKRKEQRIGKRRKAAEVKAAKTDNANRRAMVEGSPQDDQGGGPQVDGYDYYAGDEWQNHQNVLNQEHTIGGYTATHPLTIQQQDGQQGQGYDYYTQDEWQANQQATAGRQLSIQQDEYWATQQQAQQQGYVQDGYYYAPREYHYR